MTGLEMFLTLSAGFIRMWTKPFTYLAIGVAVEKPTPNFNLPSVLLPSSLPKTNTAKNSMRSI